VTSREQFIGTVSKALGREKTPAVPAPFAWRHSVHTEVMKDFTRDDLARAFMEYSRKVGADVIETTRDGLNAAIQNAVEGCGPGPVIMANDPLLNELCTAEALETGRKVQVWNSDGSRGSDLRFAEEASVGIAVAEKALAESATILLFSHKGCGRSVTLLPESVIYVVPKSLICPRLTQGMAYLRQNKENLPASVNFVSGPSATSDIELVRVVGVHGPSHVIHIVVNDI
jgi:L-lactate dehydrogenase complex protein LldG